MFQFGAAAAGIGQWKLQVDYGRPSCRWPDGARAVLLPAARQTGELADILLAGTVVIGGKRIRADQTDVGTDQFHGDLDAVEFGRRVLPSDA